MHDHKHHTSLPRTREAIKTTVISAVANVVLAGAKLVIGLLSNSAALVADALHSLSDLISDFVVVAGIKFADKPADETHRYGHGKIETLAIAIVGLLLVWVAAEIMFSAVSDIYGVWSGHKRLSPPHMAAFYAAGISVLVKELLYRYTMKVGQAQHSLALIANAWHHRSDALSSVAALLGIGGALFLGPKFRILDPVAGLLVGIFVVKVGAKFVWDSVGELLERAPDESTMKQIMDTICSVSGAVNAHNLRARRVGRTLVIEFHIEVDPNLSVREAHDIATHIENRLRERFGKDTIITTHIEPREDG